MSETDSPNRVKTITLGCRLNVYESEVMRTHALSQLDGDVVIINTCAVTNEAERQSRQAVRRAKKENPSARIIVAGCSAQINPEIYADMPEVERVLGNHEKMQAQHFLPEPSQKIIVNDIMQVQETAHHLVSGFETKTRAFIEIQNGCDHRCTFCTIPFARGNNRSSPVAEIARQVTLLVQEGCQEVVFTGVDITGYGQDLPGSPTLGQMIRRVLAQVPQLKRLRLSSLDPSEIDDELMQLIGSEPRLMPHLHISLQAGDDMILKRMKRRHLRQDVISFCQKVRTLRPDVVFGADIIAGFPTETDEMFENTLDLVKMCHLTYLHVFPYSKRAKTPASRMPQVASHVIKARALSLRELADEHLKTYLATCVGHVYDVLIEKNQKGHTPQYAPVLFDEADPMLVPGSIVKARIQEVRGDKLVAERVPFDNE